MIIIVRYEMLRSNYVHAFNLKHVRTFVFCKKLLVELLSRAQTDKLYHYLLAVSKFLDNFTCIIIDEALFHFQHEYLAAVHEPHRVKNETHRVWYFHKKSFYALVRDGYRTAVLYLAAPQMSDRAA